MKACTKCGLVKPLTDYYKKKEGKDGLSSYCKRCLIGAGQARRYADPEKSRQMSRAYYERNHEHVKRYAKNRYQDKKEEVKDYIKQWKQENREKVTATNAKRHAAKLKAIPIWADFGVIEVVYEFAYWLSIYYDEQFHVDHIVPLVSDLVCGLHCEANLRVVTAFENLSKHNSWWPDMP